MSQRIPLVKVIEFAKLMLRFQSVIREIQLAGRDYKENDVEHSYNLAMMCWYLNSAYKLGLDNDKLITYSLLHDLAEVYAGDTFFYDQKAREDKVARELAARVKLEKEYPEMKPMLAILETYEETKFTESNAMFVNAVDKFVSPLSVYLDGGRSWHEHSITLQALHANKAPKVAHTPVIAQLLEDLVDELKKHPEYFPK